MKTIMEQQETIRLLLSIQEHPELYTDEQISKMLADNPQLAELMEQLAQTKRAFVKQEADMEDIPVDDLWEQFASEHEEELDHLESQQKQESTNHPTFVSLLGKMLSISEWQARVAASFIGLLVVSGIAFAAINFVRYFKDLKTASPKSEMTNPPQQQPNVPVTNIPLDTVKTDTASVTAATMLAPVIFDNVPLGEMLPQIAAYYHADVSFQDETARQLRFYFVWKHEDGLEHAVEKLNRFESLSLRLEGNQIIVE